MNNGLPVGHAHVAAAKAALRGFVRALAQDAAGSDVTANVVSPGTINTEARRSVAPVIEGWDPVGASVLGRMLRMDEVAALCLYLCQPEAAILNGQVLNADGGTYGFGE
jgi:3-oxoacyl-[acyl-carrier protein] reductase